jgi:hypothetical protein
VIGFGAPKIRFARLKLALFRGRRPGRLCFTVDNTVRLLQTGVAFFPALIKPTSSPTTPPAAPFPTRSWTRPGVACGFA